MIGPSPQAWGTHPPFPATRRQRRAIPTGVGNSRLVFHSPGVCPGHPHRRGELSWSRRTMPRASGPSPQAWGTRGCVRDGRSSSRAIPTGVGNSQGVQVVHIGPPGHPHRRGELDPGGPGRSRPRGPSPQAWGTPEVFGPTGSDLRAIPTGVGNSSSTSTPADAAAGHPHRRGELRDNVDQTVIQTGPSPQAWGTPAGCEIQGRAWRAIPTGVGNS